MTTFKGTGVALVTPFNKNLSVDFEALRSLVELQIAGGTDFLVVMGTTAESPTLDQKEKDAILQTVIEAANHRLPIVYGVGGNNTHLVGEALKRVPKGRRNQTGHVSVKNTAIPNERGTAISIARPALATVPTMAMAAPNSSLMMSHSTYQMKRAPNFAKVGHALMNKHLLN